MNNIDEIRDILMLATGQRMHDAEALARIALDMIRGDRILIKVLGRNIESLTMQMKQVTKITFERDTYKLGMETQKEIIENVAEERNALRERIKKYEK